MLKTIAPAVCLVGAATVAFVYLSPSRPEAPDPLTRAESNRLPVTAAIAEVTVAATNKKETSRAEAARKVLLSMPGIVTPQTIQASQARVADVSQGKLGVQIMAVDSSQLNSVMLNQLRIHGKVNTVEEDGVTRVFVGEYTDFDSAANGLAALRDSGFIDAEVAALGRDGYFAKIMSAESPSYPAGCIHPEHMHNFSAIPYPGTR